jgi:glutamyl-tRNA synthetase
VQSRPLPKDEQALKLLDLEALGHLRRLRALLAETQEWQRDNLEQLVRDYVDDQDGLKLGKVAQPLRAALTGTKTSPPIFEVMEVLGRDEALGRLDDCLS